MSLELRRVAVAELKPAPYNPRKPLRPGMRAFHKLERSLETFGVVQPIVWNELTGHVVGGHQRLEILKHRGVAELEVIVVRLPLPDEKALNVALNNELLASDWDDDKLLGLIEELQALPEFDATLTGFDEADLRDLCFTPSTNPARQAPIPGNAADACVQITLEIDPAQWDTIRPELDALIARFNIRTHVRLPGIVDR